MSQFTDSLKNIRVTRPGIIMRLVLVALGVAVAHLTLGGYVYDVFKDPKSLPYWAWLPALASSGWILTGISGWIPKIWESRFAGPSFISLCGLTCAIAVGPVLLSWLDGRPRWPELVLCVPILAVAMIPPVKEQKGFALLATIIFALVIGCAQLYLISGPGSTSDALAVFAFAGVFLAFPRVGLYVVRFFVLMLVGLFGAAGIGAAISMRD